MRSACAELVGLSAQLYRQASKSPGEAIPKADVLKLFNGLDTLAKSARAYSDFKENQCLAANREPNAKERARLAVSKNMQVQSKSLRLGTLRGIDAAAVGINGASRIGCFLPLGPYDGTQKGKIRPVAPAHKKSS